jgi:hypothetical protein
LVFEQLQFDNYTLDVDNSVITRYGEQQGSKKGYNPKKPGIGSHHPLFAFVSDIRRSPIAGTVAAIRPAGMSVPLKQRRWYDGLFANIENTQLPLSLTG